MWTYFYEYMNSSTHYSIQNTNNIFNCLYQILEKAENKKEIINIIKINVGNKFLKQFKLYIFEKVPESEIISLL
jgi:hypothetical protein